MLVPDVETYDILPRMMSDRTRFAHLNEGHRTELFALLDEFPVCLSDKPGLCSATEHPIKVTDGFVPKQKLMEAGMIIRFDGPKASPLAYVAKTQGGVRLACAYQRVNPRTLPDLFLLCTNDGMIRKEGRGRTIFAFHYNICEGAT